MCGNSGNYCNSKTWCTDPSNEEQSYWSNDSHNGGPDCYSGGTSY